MSLEHAILGFLNYGPFSGYDLKKAFDASVRHFWAADQSQIYRTLARLAEKGWTDVGTVEQDSRPDRKVYHVTPAGRDELRRWLTSPLPQEESRSANLVQVFFASQLSDEEALAIFRAGAEQMRAALGVFDRIPEAFFGQAVQKFPAEASLTERERFFWLLTLECGLVNARSMLAWLESVVNRLENKNYSNTFDFEI
jgi:DNA-binding PadR family transcriptional regulator